MTGVSGTFGSAVFEARRSLAATRRRVTFFGHIHLPVLYHQDARGMVNAFTPVPGVAIPLGGRRWLANLGSVCQPRVGAAAAGQNLNVQMLVELKHWAKDLDFPNDRISFHVLDAHDPAAALVEYARSNHVEHMVIGGRGGMSLLQFLGSVSSRVVGEAPCTVTVVRAHDPRGPGFLW